MYRLAPQGSQARFDVESGPPTALRAGYDDQLADLPAGAVGSFASLGDCLDPADLRIGETADDHGGGSGMDALYANPG